jgi:hypothetical protein
MANTEGEGISSELILGQMLAVWQSVNTIPTGFMRCAPSARSITVGPPKSGFQQGVPRSFGEFYDHGVFGTSEAEAFAWYARMKLRYSCSSLSCTFACFVIPELIRAGINKMWLPQGGRVRFSDLEVIEVKAALPHRRHVIELSRKVSEEVAERLRLNHLTPGAAGVAEVERELTRSLTVYYECKFTGKGDGEFCHQEVVECGDHLSHNLLRCKETGTLIDFSLGQFIGAMNAGVYTDQSAFIRLLPTDEVYRVYPNPKHEIDKQNTLDKEKAVTCKSPDSSPLEFAKRVVRDCKRAIQSGVVTFCASCYAEQVSLRKCSQCHCISYCSRSCQKLHWKMHKKSCKTKIEESTACATAPQP